MTPRDTRPAPCVRAREPKCKHSGKQLAEQKARDHRHTWRQNINFHLSADIASAWSKFPVEEEEEGDWEHWLRAAALREHRAREDSLKE